MAHFEMKISCNNAAFEDAGTAQETARILREIADKLEAGQATGLFQNAKDFNGNIVGTYKLVQD